MQQNYDFSELQQKQKSKLQTTEQEIVEELKNLKLTMERQSYRQNEINLDIVKIETTLNDLEKNHDDSEKRLQHQISSLNRYESVYQSIEEDINK